MKIKIAKIFLLSTLLIAMNIGQVCLAASEEVQRKEPTQSLYTITTQLLNKEINSSIKSKYGTDWIFSPNKVCEIAGKNLSIEGVLNKQNSSKKIRLNFIRDASNYKITNISEIKN